MDAFGEKLGKGYMTKIAVVLFNLGGPDDPEIISVPMPSFMRWGLAKIISNRRAPTSREIYAHLGGGAPLLANTQAQARARESAMVELLPPNDYGVIYRRLASGGARCGADCADQRRMLLSARRRLHRLRRQYGGGRARRVSERQSHPRSVLGARAAGADNQRRRPISVANRSYHRRHRRPSGEPIRPAACAVLLKPSGAAEVDRAFDGGRDTTRGRRRRRPDSRPHRFRFGACGNARRAGYRVWRSRGA